MGRITLHGIRAKGRHGANPGERDRPQPFDVDIALELDLTAAQRSDDLADTLDYAALHRGIVETIETTSFALLERLAAAVLDETFADGRVTWAEVTIAKPQILDGATPSVTLERRRHYAYIGLGSNAGDSLDNVERAFAALTELGKVAKRSSLYNTQPWGKTDQPSFVNAVAQLETALEPRSLLGALKAIEVRLGRIPGERWGPRIIDLDLLTYDDAQISETNLRVPHEHLHQRAFVLVPLAEIDPTYAQWRDAIAPAELAGIEQIL